MKMSFYDELFCDSTIDSIKIDCRCDQKGRIPITEGLRILLGDKVIVTSSFINGYLRIYTQEEFDELSERLNMLNPMDEQVKKLKRIILEDAVRIDVDEENMMTIPNALLEKICATPGDDICILENRNNSSILICSKLFYDLIQESF